MGFSNRNALGKRGHTIEEMRKEISAAVHSMNEETLAAF
jgi:hypothetical protein